MDRFALALICAAGMLSSIAYAQSPIPAAPDCAAQATAQKLAGAALNSFMKKCERETAAHACETAAAEKKLSGAARTSFIKKCAKEAAMTPADQ